MSESNIIELPANIINTVSTAILPHKQAENIILNKLEQQKRIVICIHKDIKKDNIYLLSSYGKVLFFEEIFQNIEPSTLIFDYLIIDLRKEIHRNYYKIYLYNNQDYYFILYRYWFETNNGCLYNNELTDFPSIQTNKNNYDKLLLLQNVYEPNWCISLFRSCCIK